MSALISVIIPTFNRPLLVQEAVETVLRQEGAFEFEIIVVDDGSGPQTAAGLKRFGDRIRYIRQENAGLNPARNRGLRAVTGEYIALLDDDDVWLPNKTRLLMSALAADPAAGFVHSNFHIWKPQTGQQKSNGLSTWFPRPFTWTEMYARRMAIDTGDAYFGDIYYWSLFAPMVLPSTAIIRRSAMGDMSFPEVDSVGDWEFFARLSRRAGAVFVPIETTLNRSHEDAVRLTRVDPTLRLHRRLGLIQRLWRTDDEFMKSHGAEVEQVETECLRRLTKLAIARNDVSNARVHLRTMRTLQGNGRLTDALLWALAHVPFAGRLVAMVRRPQATPTAARK